MLSLYDRDADPFHACRPDGKKKAYVRLTADHDALDVANKASRLLRDGVELTFLTARMCFEPVDWLHLMCSLVSSFFSLSYSLPRISPCMRAAMHMLPMSLQANHTPEFVENNGGTYNNGLEVALGINMFSHSRRTVLKAQWMPVPSKLDLEILRA